MADISTYLKQILNAVYGEDVRQAIHDAIYQCYEDGSAGAIDLTARASIEELETQIEEILESGTTSETVQAKVESVINEMLEDGTLAALEVVTDETLSESGVPADSAAVGDALADIKVESTYDETVGDLTFSVTEELKSDYPVGLANAEIYADYERDTDTGELTESELLRSTSDWFALAEGVYLVPTIWTNDGTSSNYGWCKALIHEAKKSDESFLRTFGTTIINSSSSSSSSESSASLIIVGRTDVVYSLTAPTANISNREPVKNKATLDSKIFNLYEMTDEVVASSYYYGQWDITDYISPENIGLISKFTDNFSTPSWVKAIGIKTVGIANVYIQIWADLDNEKTYLYIRCSNWEQLCKTNKWIVEMG